VEPSVQVDAQASWEIDIWDRIRNQATSRERLAQAEAANLASVKLSLQAELANAYITLRGLDQQALLYQQTLQFYRTALNITRQRLADKIGNDLDVARAEAQYGGILALLYDTSAQRALALHAIAVLIGVSANGFTLPPQQDATLTLPTIPTGLPSALLQRRPDVAVAERYMASANALIGVARAAFYPNISLSGFFGPQDSGFNLLSLPNAMWSIGSSVGLPLFEGGLRRAELAFADSSYRQTRDQYRSVVLSAFQQVEDQLALNDFLSKEATEDKFVFNASSRAQNLALKLYTAGAANYLDVVVAQVTLFQAATTQLNTDIRVQQASINLIRALGGGWDAKDLPTEKQVLPFDPIALP
jgi:NodT family efflux transporter outer membrane factor (OMF) lipoprotein